MRRLTRKSLRVGKYSVPTLALLAVIVGSVAAAAYVVLSFTATLTVAANPKVAFVEWATSAKKNTFDYAVNIFPSVKTVDENSTYGVWNWDTAAHTAYLRIVGITNSANIQRVYLKVHDGVSTVVSVEWLSGQALPQAWTMFTAAASKKYAVWVEVTGASGAAVGSSSVVSVEMKVEAP